MEAGLLGPRPAIPQRKAQLLRDTSQPSEGSQERECGLAQAALSFFPMGHGSELTLSTLPCTAQSIGAHHQRQ